MCGIVGILRLDGRPVEAPSLDRFTDALAHRGPDGRGTYLSPRGDCGLGHRRLAILDLSPQGGQPMASPEGRSTIAFNGEIYNFIELRRRLESEGWRFRTETDTEVILAAYELHGPACQDLMNGMWAFAIHEPGSSSLFLSRDRFGVKPLYYLQGDGFLAFASELKAFLHLDCYRFGLDEEALRATLAMPWYTESLTDSVLAGVRKLPPGHSLTVRDGVVSLTRWWGTLDELPPAPAAKDQAEAFRELFLDACTLRMRSDVPLGSALSGGLDSGSIFSCVSSISRLRPDSPRLSPDSLNAFVAIYPGTTIQSEEHLARLVIGQAKSKGFFVEVRPERFLADLDRIVYQTENPGHWMPAGPWYVYEEMRRQGVLVSLDGHGGDELLAGYHYHPDLCFRDTMRPRFHPLRYLALRRVKRAMYADPSICALPSPAKLFKVGPYREMDRIYPLLLADQPLMEGTSSLFKGLYKDFHFGMLPTNLRNYDRFSMGHGVECRSPFLDYRLVRLAFALPDEAKIDNRHTKAVLRAAMRGIAPDPVLDNRIKLGFTNPDNEWVMGPLKPFILDATASRDFLECPFFNGPALRAQAERGYAKGEPATVAPVQHRIHTVRFLSLFRKQVPDAF